MINIFEIPYVSPFRFYENTPTPGGHFDDDWACKQILEQEMKVYYKQKMQITDSTPLQIQSSIGNVEVKVYDNQGILRKTIPFSDVTPGFGLDYTNYQAIISLSDLPSGVYYLVPQAILGDLVFRTISEPIDLRAVHKNTSVFKYKNSLNDFGVAFSTGIEYSFRCEALVYDTEGDQERVSYQDQVLNRYTQSATPYNKSKLIVGDAALCTGAPGVARWVQTLLNRIYCCDQVFIDNMSKGKFKQYERPDNAKWEITKPQGQPLIWFTTDLLDAKNVSSLQLASEVVPAGGLVASYGIETDGFGTFTNPPSTNPVQIQTIE